MPLSQPAKRKHLHTREISFTGYERDDGLFDVEGHLVDTKTYSFPNKDRGEIKAGEALHNMRLRLSINEKFVVQEVEASIDDSPFDICPQITPAFKVLEGVQIGPGWRKQVRAKLGGVKGCTHLVEMLSPIATAAYQTIYPALSARKRAKSGAASKDEPSIMGGCHVMDPASDYVKNRWPDHYQSSAE